MPTKFHLKAELQLSFIAQEESQGGKPALAHRSLGDRFFVAAWEGDHFDVGEHAVFDVDRCDVAAVVGVHEEDAAAVPEVLAVFFAGFDVQFQSLGSHF